MKDSINTGENKVGRTLHATFTRARFSSRTVYSARGAADQKRDASRATGRCLVEVLQLAKREGIAKRVLKKLEALLERR